VARVRGFCCDAAALMSRRTAVVLAWGGFLALLVLHLDSWRPAGDALLGGWLPEELAYRVGWILLAWLYLVFVCARLWREEDR
jgi:hypothetical protein